MTETDNVEKEKPREGQTETHDGERAGERLRSESERSSTTTKPGEKPETRADQSKEAPKPADKVLPKVELVEKPVPKLDQATLAKHAQELNEAIHRTKWLGMRDDPDAAKVERILGPLSKADREALEKIYAEKYGKDKAPDTLRQELKSKFGNVDGTRLESFLNRDDAGTNDAGQVRTSIARLKDDPAKANAELAQVFKQLNSEQIAKLKDDYKKHYGTNLEDDLKGAKGLSPALSESLPILMKGTDKRTAEDVVEITKKALEARNRDLLVSFISGDSPASKQAREILSKDTGFREKLAQQFPSELALQGMEYGFYDKLTLDQRTDKTISDYFKQGHIGLDTIVASNTGKWIFNNKENIELAVKNATAQERESYKLGRQMAQEKREPQNEKEKAAKEFFDTVRKSFQNGGNDRERAIWEDQLMHGRPTIVSEMAKTHSDGWDPMGWSSGHSKQDLMSKAENLSRQDWEMLRDKENGPAFRAQIEESLKTFADSGERERIMKIIDGKAAKESFDDAAKLGRSLTDTIKDNKGSVLLGLGTSHDGKSITERITKMSPDDAAKYKTDEKYRKEIQSFVENNLNATEKLLAKRLLSQVEHTGEPPKLSAIDKVLQDSIKGTKSEEAIKNIEDALKDEALRARLNKPTDQLTGEDRQLKIVMESTVLKMVMDKTGMMPEGYEFQSRMTDKHINEMLSRGQLSAATKLQWGFAKADILPQLAKASDEERKAAERYLSEDEKKIVATIKDQNGEAKLEDRLRTFIVTGNGNYKDFEDDLKKLDNAGKQALKDSYFKKYGGALNDDFLKKVDGDQGDKNIYRQYLNPAESDGRQDFYDNYSKFLESRSGFSPDGTALTAERAVELHANALESYQREFKKLTPEQQAAMNEFFGPALKQYQHSKEKLAEILVDATITAAALAAAPFTAGMSTSALLVVIGSAATAGAAYRVGMFKAIQGNDFDSSAQNIVKHAIVGGTTAALNFLGPEVFLASGRIISTAGANVARDLAKAPLAGMLREGAEKVVAREVEQLAAKRGLQELSEQEMTALVNKVVKDGATEAEKRAVRETLEASVNGNLQKAATDISEHVARSQTLARQVRDNALIGAGANVGAELVAAPFNKDGIDWDKLGTGALTGLAVGAVMPVALRGVIRAGGAASDLVTRVTKGTDGLYIDPAHIIEPITLKNVKTGETVTIRPGEGQRLKLTNDWQPHQTEVERVSGHTQDGNNGPKRTDGDPVEDGNTQTRPENEPDGQKKKDTPDEQHPKDDPDGVRNRETPGDNVKSPKEFTNPEEVLQRVKAISREFAERTREVPITKEQFEDMFKGFSPEDRKLALEIMEHSAPNMTARALDDQMRNLPKELLDKIRKEGMVVYTLAGDDSGNMLAQLMRKNYDQLEKKVQVIQLDEAAMRELQKNGIPKNGMVMSDLSRASEAQKKFLGQVENLTVTDMNGFDRGLNFVDFGAAQFAGPQAMKEKLADLVEKVKALRAADPKLTPEEATRLALRGNTAEAARAINPNAQVLDTPAPLPGRDLRSQVGGDESYRIASMYDQFTQPHLTQEQMEKYLSSIGNKDIRAYAAHVLENGVEYKSYTQMMSEFQDLHKRVLQNLPPGTKPEDVLIITGLEQPNIGSHLVANNLYARANGLTSANFISAAELAARGPGGANGKVLVYLDDFALSGRQAAGLMSTNSKLLKESGGKVVVATIGRYETKVNPWELWKTDPRYAGLEGLNVTPLTNHVYPNFYSQQYLESIGLGRFAAQMGAFNMFKPFHDSGIATYLLTPYGGPNNNLQFLGQMQDSTGLRGNNKYKIRHTPAGK